MAEVPDDTYWEDRPQMDEEDIKWISTFGEGRIPKGAMVEGFVAIISYIQPDGDRGWDAYNTLDMPLSNILGLMDMAQFKFMHDNFRVITEEDD